MSKFTEKHAELWKFIKFTFAGMSSSVVELVVHQLLLSFVFVSLKDVVIDNAALNFIGVNYKAYLYAYFISTAVGYGIAFVVNRKLTFHADSNPTISVILYILMVIFTIFATAWIGSALTTLAVKYDWYSLRAVGGIMDILIKLAVMLLATAWTYPCNRFIIHRKKNTAENS
ncbi:MAG: hypothetical protein FWF05_08140 [Oscillospiraceae bacterium]|nr:hypothetical protein [Oscillospiraceae bacterium]